MKNHASHHSQVFLVSAELQEGGVGGVKIQSEKGRPCAVQNPWPGRKVLLTRNGKAAEPAGDDRFTFLTASGEIIVLQPNN